jgi:hypothetical protein
VWTSYGRAPNGTRGIRAALRTLPGERWIALASLVVAMCALTLSVSESRQRRVQERLSVRPYVSISFVFNDKGAGWDIGNDGLGPAIYRWFAVRVDGQPLSDWAAMATALGLPPGLGIPGVPPDFSYVVPHTNWMLRQDQHGQLFWVTSDLSANILKKNVRRAELTLCYCSLYDECWEIDTAKTGGPVPHDCSSAPPAPFGSPPIVSVLPRAGTNAP